MNAEIKNKMKSSPESFSGRDLKELMAKENISVSYLVDQGIIPEALSGKVMRDEIEIPTFHNIDESNILHDSERTDVFFIGLQNTGKTSMLSGLLYEGFTSKEVFFDDSLYRDSSESYRTYYQLLESVNANKFVTSSERNKFSSIPVKIDMHARNLHDKQANFFEISGEFWASTGNSIENLNPRLKEMMGACYNPGNRKILVFVVDYNAIATGQDVLQRSVLDNILLSFNNDGESDGHGGYTKHCTMSKVDGIAIVMTKSDKIVEAESLTDFVKDYLESEYITFMNTMAETCKKYGIKEPLIETFSIGKVYVGGLFEYKRDDSRRILDFVERFCLKNTRRNRKALEKKLEEEERARLYKDSRVNALENKISNLEDEKANLEKKVIDVKKACEDEMEQRCMKIEREKQVVIDDLKVKYSALQVANYTIKAQWDEDLDKRTAEIVEEKNKLDKELKETQGKHKRSKGWCIALFILLLGGIVAIIYFSHESQRYRNLYNYYFDRVYDLRNEKQRLQDDLNKAEKKYSDAKSKLSSISSKIPIVINDLKVGNVYENGNIETNYGNTIYSRYTMYLKPKIYYTPVEETGSYITLKVKLFRPNNELSTGSSSPYGYTYSYDTYISSSGESTLNGWGNSDKGHWGAGTYRYEIWYEGRMLYTKSFTVYN